LLPFQLYDGMRFPKDNNALYAFAVWLFLAMLYLSSIPKDNNTLYAFVVIPSQFSGAWLRNQSWITMFDVSICLLIESQRLEQMEIFDVIWKLPSPP
jgi:hypothetical protein